ncbi:hypothetical protein GCM10011348_10410 [Marinobacterium nitratireducens]|uniref:Uncharacterized protein n=1 Tax=Marinobacterium nitratireducens TaxID=518897 RepID=A0A917Z950_9GAMM|nr:SH3 domain-containing protein [Marinobacterium nitratireducens]GGO78455.1 hypothetical protein GCM10011348_10410 [Marinobacterium nitratireducens]
MNVPEQRDHSCASMQRSLLAGYPDCPDATSTLFLNHLVNRNADDSESHTLVGVHIRLAPGDDNGLWTQLHVERAQTLDPRAPRVATSRLLICCDTLEVCDELSLPEAEVVIHARRLIWKGERAAINTSPLDWALDRAPKAVGGKAGENGADGRHAGDLRIFVRELEPAADTRPRLLARGGAGQQPGEGLPGSQGKDLPGYTSVPFKIVDSKISTSKATLKFKPAAVYIDYAWHFTAIKVASGKIGIDEFPGNGTAALPPGAPGAGGNGGRLYTSLPALAPLLLNDGGAAGSADRRRYPGGRAGRPVQAAKYRVKLWENLLGTDNASNEIKKTASNTSKAGANAAYDGNDKPDGSTPATQLLDEPCAWLHPLGVQKTLEYARDLYLAGRHPQVERLLQPYEASLAGEAPSLDAWGEGSQALWRSLQSEVASMLQRLRGQLDYFGHAAGFTPLFSLQGTVQLYREETRRALRTLLLAGWVQRRADEAGATVKALGESIDSLNDESRQAAQQVLNAEAEIDDLGGRISVLEAELATLGNRLQTLRNRLLTEAQGELDRQAQIRAAIHVAAAICQVVPVGQPALGTVGSLAGVAAGLVGDDGSGVPDTLSQMGEVLSKSREAAKKSKGSGAQAAQDKGDTGQDGAAASQRASAWAQVGDGLGPALSEVSQGIRALQVPASEVEAKLQELQSESEAWQDLVRDIRALNERKVALFDSLASAFQTLGAGYGRITGNAAAVVSLQQSRAATAARLDAEATAVVQQMAQRARLTLLHYLYLMVRAYETTVLKPIRVDWKLTEVADRIDELVRDDDDAAALLARAEVLEPLYRQNLDRVRQQLLEDFSFQERELPLKLGLSDSQTPQAIAELNSRGETRLDPLALGLVVPDYQQARIAGVELKALELDPDGPPLPEGHNLIVSLQPSRQGTLRRGEALYAVHSEQPPVWSWTQLSGGELRPARPSQGTEDMLELVLGDGAASIRQKVAQAPVWSALQVRVRFSPGFAAGQWPRIRRLYFELNCAVTPAPEHQCVLRVLPHGNSGGALVQCTPDLAGRGAGLDQLVRIYSRGAAVRLEVPELDDFARFDGWDLVGRGVDRVGEHSAAVELGLDDHVLAVCHWQPPLGEAPAVVLSEMLTSEDLGELATAGGAAIGPLLQAPRPLADDRLRIAPADDAAVIGWLPSLDDAELLEQQDDGWQQLNYRGITGWVRLF